MSGIIKTPILKIFILLSMILIGTGKAYCRGNIEMDTTDLHLIPKLWRIISERSDYKAPIDKTVFFQDFKGKKKSYTVVKIDSVFQVFWTWPDAIKINYVERINIDTLKYENKLLVYKSTNEIGFNRYTNEGISKMTTSQSFRHLGDTILSYQLQTGVYTDTFDHVPYIYADSVNYIYNGITIKNVLFKIIFDNNRALPPKFNKSIITYDYSGNGLLLSIRSILLNDTIAKGERIRKFNYYMPEHTKNRGGSGGMNCSKKISLNFLGDYIECYFDDQYRECLRLNTNKRWKSRYSHDSGYDNHDTTYTRSNPKPSSISYFTYNSHKLEKVITKGMYSSQNVEHVSIRIYSQRKRGNKSNVFSASKLINNFNNERRLIREITKSHQQIFEGA